MKTQNNWKNFLSFALRVIVAHVATYFMFGILMSNVFDYKDIFRHEIIRDYMLPFEEHNIVIGPFLQPFRGLIFAIGLWPIRSLLIEKKHGWLTLWGLLVTIGILSTPSAAPSSLEGMLYSKLPMWYHLMGFPEIMLQTLVFSIWLVWWEHQTVMSHQPEPKKENALTTDIIKAIMTACFAYIGFAVGGLLLVAISACSGPQNQPAPAPVLVETLQVNMPNPASKYCEQQGNQLEIRTNADGSQNGVCIFPGGSECDEWAYYRGECKPVGTEVPSATPEFAGADWEIYRNELFGYSFQYPAEAEIIANDDPLKSLQIYGSGMGSESWGISHPTDREEYRPPEGVDLLQWLTDHYLIGEKRLPDVQIAGIRSIHFRHERSPQSYADDRYFFARSGQLYMLIIGHAGDTEDWELNNRFLQSFQFREETSNPSSPTLIPTVLSIDPAEYQG